MNIYISTGGYKDQKGTEIFELLKSKGIKNVEFSGGKYIKNFDKNFNKNILLKRRFWFAASTHKEEDLFCLKTHLKLKEKFKDVTEKYILGNPLEMETNLGPVVKQSAANNIRSEVNNAISQGGKNIIDNKKFNLDDASLFIEFEEKILNE